ncbi:MAG: hypothetical protein Q8N59_02275, partial [bacterium]|nr:hypothetical protein [bacterium]
MELKHKSFFILLAIVIGILIGIAVWKFIGPTLGRGVFYYRIDGDKANLFLLKNSSSKKLVFLPAREIDPGDFRPPKRSYVSNSRKEMIYFKQIEEVPVEGITENQEFVVNRIVYKPILVNLKNGKETEINQLIDSAGVVFSPNDKEIAWIKQIDEVTYSQIEQSGKKREIWISDGNGESAELLVGFDENLVILKKWVGDYIYFQGLWDIYSQSMGRINIKTKQVEYLIPRGCVKSLENCKNIEFALSGNKFLYEIVSKKDDKDITELYLGDFDKNEFLAILTTDQIGNRVWVDDGEMFFYTEQEVDKFDKVTETIHLVDIKNQTDDSVYSGNYISQLTFDWAGRYLYFIEKQEEGENFNLMILDLKTKKTEILLT